MQSEKHVYNFEDLDAFMSREKVEQIKTQSQKLCRA